MQFHIMHFYCQLVLLIFQPVFQSSKWGFLMDNGEPSLVSSLPDSLRSLLFLFGSTWCFLRIVHIDGAYSSSSFVFTGDLCQNLFLHSAVDSRSVCIFMHASKGTRYLSTHAYMYMCDQGRVSVKILEVGIQIHLSLICNHLLI